MNETYDAYDGANGDTRPVEAVNFAKPVDIRVQSAAREHVRIDPAQHITVNSLNTDVEEIGASESRPIIAKKTNRGKSMKKASQNMPRIDPDRDAQIKQSPYDSKP